MIIVKPNMITRIGILILGLSVTICISTPANQTSGLLLTPLIKLNQLQEARNASTVDPSLFLNVTSHAGYLTVNERYDSNLYFWYFPVAGKPVNETPWIVWLQGGPGASSLAGLFDEIGPFEYDGELKRREWSWTANYSMLFIDNPVGAGFSFTNSNDGFVTNMEECSNHLYDALQQFLTIFPELRGAPLYIAGESYAGRYVPSLGYKIMKQQPSGNATLNLKGMMLGDPVIDRIDVANISSVYYHWGLLDTQGLLAAKPLQDQYFQAIKNNDVSKAYEGVGEFEQPLELHIQPGAKPIVKPPRRVPHAVLDRLKEKLKSLEEHRIIEKVEHPKSFVSNAVIIEKNDGSLRICLDPKELNEVLVREYYLIPTLQEIVAKLANKKVFTVLDLSDGFYNIKLTEKSSDLCSFSTPVGCYKFCRLPFGLSVAPEIFQKYSERTFGDIPGVVIYCDDLLICAENEEEHDKILTNVFKRAKENNVRFNKRKFQYKLEEVKYLGHVFSKNGMSVDPHRVKAILNIKSPKTKKELQIFLGMVNYLRTFIDKLADLAAPLQALLKKM